jgi:hypothetical protein
MINWKEALVSVVIGGLVGFAIAQTIIWMFTK